MAARKPKVEPAERAVLGALCRIGDKLDERNADERDYGQRSQQYGAEYMAEMRDMNLRLNGMVSALEGIGSTLWWLAVLAFLVILAAVVVIIFG